MIKRNLVNFEYLKASNSYCSKKTNLTNFFLTNLYNFYFLRQTQYFLPFKPRTSVKLCLIKQKHSIISLRHPISRHHFLKNQLNNSVWQSYDYLPICFFFKKLKNIFFLYHSITKNNNMNKYNFSKTKIK